MAITWRAIRSMTTALAQAMAISMPIEEPGVTSARSLGREPVEQGLERRNIEALVIRRVAHLHRWRRATAGETFDLLEGELSVRRALAGCDPEAAFDARPQLIRPPQRAGQVHAQLEVVAALRLGPEHRVEGDYRRHPREGDLHQVRDVLLDRE